MAGAPVGPSSVPGERDRGRDRESAPAAAPARPESWGDGAARARAPALWGRKDLDQRAPRGALLPGAAEVAALVGARAKELEALAQAHASGSAELDRALAVVRSFAAERRLVLYGGLAIDHALRLRGSQLYPDGMRPDFDFFSPRSVDDAFDLAERLAASFAAVSAIRAVHVQTMRVRVAFRTVADISYAPPPVFSAFPVLEAAGLRILHPDFQRMDIHLALCYPFGGAPREAVFHRWRKDLKRFAELERLYPLVSAEPGPAGDRRPTEPPASSAGETKAPPERVSADVGLRVAGKAAELKVALHGFAAYSALRSALSELARRAGQPEFPPGAPAPPPLSLSVERSEAGADRLQVDVPVGGVVHLASFAAEEAAGPAAEAFEPFMDLAPPCLRRGRLAVFSTRGRRLAASIVRLAAGGEELQAWVVSPQALLLLFLLQAHRAPAGERPTWRAFYGHTLSLLRRAEALCAAVSPGPREALELLAQSPFGLSVRTFGPVETDPAYLVRLADLSAKLGEQAPPAATGLPPRLLSVLAGLPRNYYPTRAREGSSGESRRSRSARPEFSYGASAFFRRAGGPVDAAGWVALGGEPLAEPPASVGSTLPPKKERAP